MNTPGSSKPSIEFALIMSLGAAVFLPVGILRIGLLYTIDGVSGTLHRMRKFGSNRAWEPGSLRRVTIIVEPQTSREREKLVVDIRAVENDKIIERLYTKESRRKDSIHAVEIGVAAGKLLKIPVEVYGVVEHGTPELTKALNG